MPTVSVIIPTYQRAELVGKAIASVLAQTYSDYEIIVVNDGSTDNTQSILAQFGDRLTVINQVNQGLSAARNAGIKAAVGKYIAFLDDDDRWVPEKLALQVPILESKPKIGLVSSDIYLCDDTGQIIGKSAPRPKVKTSWSLFEKNYIYVPTVVVRRACLDQVGLFDESLTACEDYDLWLRISEKWAIHCLEAPLAYYRHVAGTMTSDKEQMIINWLQVKAKAMDRHSLLRRLPLGYLDRSYYDGYLYLAKFYLRGDQRVAAAKTLAHYRQRRGYNLQLEQLQQRLQTGKKITPPRTMSQDKKFIFVHIPKTAGSSIIEALFPELRDRWGSYQGHYLPQEYTAEIWQDYFTFCFIRNPWDRLVSLYHYWQDLINQKATQGVSFREFCLSFPQFVGNIYHRYQQVDFIARGDRQIDFIGRFEHLERDFQFISHKLGCSVSLPHLIPSKRDPDYRNYYNDETREFVATFFAEDIRLGDYKF